VLSSLSSINYWQKAQRGHFTRLQHSDYLDLASYLEAKGYLGNLTKYELPAQEAGAVLDTLESMNISYATLFPDLHGAARQANIANALIVMGYGR